MHIKKLNAENFTNFDVLDIEFSRNINIFSGPNGIGKTNILKALYGVTKVLDEINVENQNRLTVNVSKEKANEMLINKFIRVYRCDTIGRLVKRKVGRGKAKLNILLEENEKIEISFSRQAVRNIEIEDDIREIGKQLKPVYIPPKEIISAVENFSAIYENYHIAFEETYYDLNKLLLLPTRKGPNSEKQRKLLKQFEGIVDGKVVFKEGKFYLKTQGQGEFEMGLVAEGSRKWATLLQLVQNGVLTENAILFWDEPESNINPNLIKSTVDVLVALAKMGVQIFITTHSYFLQQEFDLYSKYKANKDKIKINFISLYANEDGTVLYENAPILSELEHNIIMKEFENLYNREQDLFYGD
ncbi:MAG: AAA family ATPase [Bacillota bacterium]